MILLKIEQAVNEILLIVLLYTPLCHTVTLLTKNRDAVPISYYYLIGTASHGI